MLLEVQVEEKVTYESKFTIVQPDDMSDEKFQNILTDAQFQVREKNTTALITLLRDKYGLQILEYALKDLSVPTNKKLEITGVGTAKMEP